MKEKEGGEKKKNGCRRGGAEKKKKKERAKKSKDIGNTKNKNNKSINTKNEEKRQA